MIPYDEVRHNIDLSTGLERFWKVLESYGKLWKLIMPFSRTWKALEKEKFFKIATGKFRIFLGKF